MARKATYLIQGTVDSEFTEQVISPLLWTLVADEVLKNITVIGCQVVG